MFIPQKFERYSAALRNHIHLSALHGGINRRHLINLQKITRAEALFNRENKEPLDLSLFSFYLLSAAYIILLEKRKSPIYKINPIGSFLINKELFSVLILSLCKTASEIEIKTIKSKIIIKAIGADIIGIKKIITALNGIYFLNRKENRLLVVISAVKTDKKSIAIKKEWEYILDPFSLVNIYLNQ